MYFSENYFSTISISIFCTDSSVPKAVALRDTTVHRKLTRFVICVIIEPRNNLAVRLNKRTIIRNHLARIDRRSNYPAFKILLTVRHACTSKRCSKCPLISGENSTGLIFLQFIRSCTTFCKRSICPYRIRKSIRFNCIIKIE